MSEIDSSQRVRDETRRLTEKALEIRCKAYRAMARAAVLTDTIFEIDSSRRELLHVNDRISRQAQRIAEQNRHLERKSDVLETLAFGLAHDLHQPVVAMQITLDTLAMNRANASNVEECEEQLRSAISSLRGTVEEMLHLAVFTQRPLTKQTLDVSEYAMEYVHELRASEPGRPVGVRIEPEVTISGDPDLVRLIVRNLLTNAWKFTRSVSPAEIELGWSDDGDGAVFVRDNGVGFDTSNVEGGRPRTARAHLTAPSGDVPGFGFGMATVRHAVRHHGGRFWFESKPGSGATFFFALGGSDSFTRPGLGL